MIDAAAELFLEHGFEGTSVGDVVHNSGGSLATLYTWFGSKEGLFEAIVTEVSARLVAELETPELESRPLDEALRVFGEKFLGMALCSDAVRWHRICVAEGHKFPALRAVLLRTGPGPVGERLAAYLAAQAEAGRLNVEDPAAAALHFFALLKSQTHFSVVCGESARLSAGEIETQVRRAVEVFLHGYCRAVPGAAARPKSTAKAVLPRRRARRSPRSGK